MRVHNFGASIADLNTLFDPLHRGERQKSKSAGLGLGLYIAKKILEAHGGELEVESSDAAGTTFEARFPVF